MNQLLAGSCCKPASQSQNLQRRSSVLALYPLSVPGERSVDGQGLDDGAVALDFAVPIAYAPYDSKQLFSFFVGFAR